MGLARDLTMGPRRPRTRLATTGPYATARRLTAKAEWTPDDRTAMAAAIAEIMATRTRLRFAEGAVLNAACLRYREVTGERIGPETSHY